MNRIRLVLPLGSNCFFLTSLFIRVPCYSRVYFGYWFIRPHWAIFWDFAGPFLTKGAGPQDIWTDVLIMDFPKAFYKVGHQRLIHMLAYCGIRGNINEWIQALLSCSSQQVVLISENSERIHVQSGVLQGSVLGPCLFLLICPFSWLIYRRLKPEAERLSGKMNSYIAEERSLEGKYEILRTNFMPSALSSDKQTGRKGVLIFINFWKARFAVEKIYNCCNCKLTSLLD